MLPTIAIPDSSLCKVVDRVPTLARATRLLLLLKSMLNEEHPACDSASTFGSAKIQE